LDDAPSTILVYDSCTAHQQGRENVFDWNFGHTWIVYAISTSTAASTNLEGHKNIARAELPVVGFDDISFEKGAHQSSI